MSTGIAKSILTFQTPSVVDDAGVRRPVLDPNDPRVTDPGAGDLLMRAMDRTYQVGLHAKAHASTSVPASLGIVVFIGGSLVAQYSGLPPSTGFAMFIPLLLVNPWLSRRFQHFETRAAVVEEFLKGGRCPCCGEAIASDLGENGLRRCPKCASAWQASRVGPLAILPAGMATASRWHAMPTIKDSRDEWRRLADTTAVAAKDVMFRPLAEEIRRRTLFARIAGVLGLCSLFAVIVALILLPQLGVQTFLSIPGAPVKAPTIVDWLGMACLFMFFGWMVARVSASIWRGATSLTKSRTASVILEDGRCPSCLTTLAWNGKTTAAPCPRCLAVWSLTEAKALPAVLDADRV